MTSEHSVLVSLLGGVFSRSCRRSLTGLLCAGMVALAAGEVTAHDHNHPEMNEWFKSLHSKGGAWCCTGDDAEIADWDLFGDHYRVKIGDQWVTVPEDAIVQGENKVGGARVWSYYTNGRPNVRCFLPDALT